MKILFHHRTLAKDGMDVHIQELCAALRDRGHDVLIVGPASKDDAFGGDGGAMSRIRKALPKSAGELLEFAYNARAYGRLKRACETFKPDILYERYNLYLLAGAWLAKQKRLPFLVEVNSPLFQERLRHDGLRLKALASWSEKKVWRAADRVLPVSDVLADFVRRAGVADDRVAVIPNGVNRARFPVGGVASAVRTDLGLGDRIVLGFTGFFRPWHGLDRVIEALPRLAEAADVHLLIVGDGPIKDDLKRLAEARGVADRVTFAGLVGRDDIAKYIAAFDIALQPAVVDYASPLKLFEYLALGKPVIAPNQPNIRELVEDGRTALLFDPEADGAFETALARLVGDAALRAALSAGASASIEARRFLWSENARRIEDMAAGLMARGGEDGAPK